jgi:hypothetical protein
MARSIAVVTNIPPWSASRIAVRFRGQAANADGVDEGERIAIGTLGYSLLRFARPEVDLTLASFPGALTTRRLGARLRMLE